MAELEQRLHALGAEVDWPATPELRVPVPGPRRRSRRPLVLALAVLLVALAAAFAVPRARTSILRFLHLEGVTVERVDRLPAARQGGELHLGAPVSLAEARRRLGVPILFPHGRRPDATYFDPGLARGGVTLRYGPADHPRLLVGEFMTANLPVIEKYVYTADPVNRVTIGGRPGMWIPRRHVVDLGLLPPRLSTSALIWSAGRITIRLEGDLPRRDAVELARSFRR